MNRILKSTLKATLLVGLLFSLLAASCKKEVEEPEEAYYNFTAEDYIKILDFSLNDTITFKNQEYEKVKMVVSRIKEELKIFYTTYAYPNSHDFFYYDYKTIEYKLIELNPELYLYTKYSFSRFPLDLEKAKDDKYIKYPSVFNASISFPFYNGIKHEKINYDSTKLEMVIGSEIYSNVFTIKSGINDSVLDRWGGFDYYKKVNVLYYDEFNGLIGFDDVLGNNWRLKE